MATHRGVDPDRLTGEAARQFDTLRRMHQTFGSDPEQATRFAINDLIESRWIERSPFDEQVDFYRGLGLSEAGAKRAAIGRGGSEYEARRESESPVEGEAPRSGPAAMAAAHRLLGEARALREAAAEAKSDELRARALDLSIAKLQEALRYIPDRHLEGVSTSTPVKPTESRGMPSRRSKTVLSETQRQGSGRG